MKHKLANTLFALTMLAAPVLPTATAQGLPEGVSAQDVLSALSAPISVPAGQTTTVSLPVAVDAAYSGDGWDVSASGGSATVVAPAEGGQVSVPVTFNGYSATITLVASAAKDAQATNSDAANPDGNEQTAQPTSPSDSSGTGASASTALPAVPGSKPEREQAAAADTTNTEHIYLASQIDGNVITAHLSLEQAVALYNRFGNIDKDTVTLRYVDGDGLIIQGVERKIDAAARALTLTYPEGQAPDNPFIMQLVNNDGSGVAVQATLRDPNFASADDASAEQLAEESAQTQSSSRLPLLLAGGAVTTILLLAVIIVAVIRRRRSS